MKFKTIRKIVGTLLICVSLVVASFPTERAIADTSVITDFQLNGDTLVKYTGTATTVSVPATVKIIGEEAFSDNTNLIELNLPDSVEKISYAAFSGCNHLKKVVIPNSVTEIGTAAFCNCEALSEFSFGSNVTRIGTGLFTGCKLLSSVTGNEHFVFIDGAIYDKEIETLYEVLPNAKVKRDASSNEFVNLTRYVMPDSVKDIKPYAFYGCKNINEIIFSNYLEEIPAFSFSYCNGLKTLNIPYSVNRIDMKAFEYCINLKEVNIPVSATYIHETAFDGCPKLNILAPTDSYAYNWFLNHDNSEVNIIDSEDNEDAGDISGNNPDRKKPPIDGLIGETVIVGRQAVFFIDNSSMNVVSGKYADSDLYADIISDMEAVLQTETNGKGLTLPKFAILGNAVAGKAFYGDTDLKSYEFPEGIETIGDFAFARSGLTSVTIPAGVTSIGYGAFYHCDDLSQILVPSTVTNIEPSAFSKTKMYELWYSYSDEDFLVMGDGILIAYKGNEASVAVPDNVKQIGPEAFKNNKSLREIIIPESVERICEEAFLGCSSLTKISGGMNLSIIEDRAFYGCPIKSVRMVDTVKEIGLGAFYLRSTGLSDSEKTVMFHGNELPVVSYNNTTTRLTNSDYRIDALEDVRVAVVSSENINRIGTVLDRDISGFSGLICIIGDEGNEYFNGTLKIIDCTLTALEAQRYTIPETVYIYGKGYNFDSNELESVLNMARDGAYHEPSENPLTVSFTGSDESYILDVTKDTITNNSLCEAYKRIYADNIPANFSTYEISLTDSQTGCNITKFGKQTLGIYLPLPDNMPTTNLHVICTDENNQLEDLPFAVKAENGTLNVFFDINHTGHYGLYSFNSTAVSPYNLDESPDTGDLVHPKWFLATGIFTLGLALILIKSKKKENGGI